jgi:predicted membrane-bound spermidine synthase
MAISARDGVVDKRAFLGGVFLISFAMLIFQIVQTRILSVIAWYYLAFFAISVAMLGMTVGAVLVYLRGDRLQAGGLAPALSDHALAFAISMPVSMLVQLSLITSQAVSLVTLVAWSLLLTAMAAPYVFAGVAVSLALTRSSFQIGQVYAADLLGAALGCVSVVLILNFLDAPSAIVLAGAIAGLSSFCFARAASPAGRERLRARSRYLRPTFVVAALLALTLAGTVSPVRIRPILVKDNVDHGLFGGFERWNSYSRVIAGVPISRSIPLWGPSPALPTDRLIDQIPLNIDGRAGTDMFHYDGTLESIDFLRFDLVNLAYNLPGIHKAAIIGVGGGRDLLAAHLFGVSEIVGVELNPIFIDLHTREPLYKDFSNLTALPNLRLFVDDARSWFASTHEKFDLIQMSMIDTWAATGAGAFSLSENGLYTLQGWRAFIRTLNDGGILTVSRWYNPGDVNESGRMIALAIAALWDAGVADARPHLFVAHAKNIATLVLSKSPLTTSQIATLRAEVRRLGFDVLLAPDEPPRSELLAAMVASKNLAALNDAAGSQFLDLTVPTDDRPFFFNQLRFSKIPEAARMAISGQSGLGLGVVRGNLLASGALVLILFISIAAVICTILLPLRGVTRNRSIPLIAVGSAYFSLIGIGFMLAEIGLLQYFSVYLGHPIYSLSVCLFSLILATGLGSLASERLSIASPRAMLIWGLLVGCYLFGLQAYLTSAFAATTGRELSVRIAVSLGIVMPLGFLLGFAFPTGMKLVEAVDPQPTPWFWGINGATGVLASVLAVMLSMAFGIRVTLSVAAVCYLCLIPAGLSLIAMDRRKEATAQRPDRSGARELAQERD